MKSDFVFIYGREVVGKPRQEIGVGLSTGLPDIGRIGTRTERKLSLRF